MIRMVKRESLQAASQVEPPHVKLTYIKLPRGRLPVSEFTEVGPPNSFAKLGQYSRLAAARKFRFLLLLLLVHNKL